jgi:hypothetical protein
VFQCGKCFAIIDNINDKCHLCGQQGLTQVTVTPMDIVSDYHKERNLTGKDKPDPFKEQVGGGHYKSMKIQPIEFVLANELGFCEGNIIKYTCRYKQKGGVEDLKKVIHYAQLLIAQLEKENK